VCCEARSRVRLTVQGSDGEEKTITVAASCFFGVPNFRFHLFQVLVLTFLIALVLVAIADIDRPYQGLVKVCF
jgi:hypothetical protein